MISCGCTSQHMRWHLDTHLDGTQVWNAVDNQSRKGHTSVIHGKWQHEETIATASFAGTYVIVKVREHQHHFVTSL